MPLPKKSSSLTKKTIKKTPATTKKTSAVGKKIVAKRTTTKKVVAKKPLAKKAIKQEVKTRSIITKVKDSNLKKFVIEEENYLPEDSFVEEESEQKNFESNFGDFILPDPEDGDENDEEDDEADAEVLIDEDDEVVEDDEEHYGFNQNEIIEKPYNRDEYDFQRKFYRSLANESKEKKEEGVEQPQRHSVSFYRKFAIRFTIAVIVLIGIVAFFSFSKLTISIVPNEELVNENLNITIADNAASSTDEVGNTIKGAVQSLIIEDEKMYSASGEGSSSEDFIGKVFIINENNISQTLVAKTRVLTSDNKLFRIKNAVNVPAGGEVEVAVYPDVSSPEMAIYPSNFTIPGLNEALQKKIYAESREAFAFNSNSIKYISADDLANAKKDLSLALMEKAKVEATERFSQYDKVIYNVDITKIVTVTSAKEGEKKDEFKMKARGSVQVIAFSQADAMKLIDGKLKVSIPEGQVLSGLNESSISYTLENTDEAKKIASVKVAFSGRTTLAEGTEIIDNNKIVNLNRDQINDYLKTLETVSAYKLDFSPSFINKAPSLSDRIKVEIVSPEVGITNKADSNDRW